MLRTSTSRQSSLLLLLFAFLISRILLKKSGSDVPRVELEEMGPSLVFVMRRTHLAPDQLYKKARRKPKTVKVSQ